MSRRKIGGEDKTANGNVSSLTEPAATPLISVADVPMSAHPVVHLPDDRRYVVEERAARIAESWSGSVENHVAGKLGEDALARYLGVEDELDLDVYADGGDGGSDLQYRNANIEVKTTSRRHADDPRLRVSVYDPLEADYYGLVSRVGKGDFRIVGYAPRRFVANARQRSWRGDSYHVVDPEYLYPFFGSKGVLDENR